MRADSTRSRECIMALLARRIETLFEIPNNSIVGPKNVTHTCAIHRLPQGHAPLPRATAATAAATAEAPARAKEVATKAVSSETSGLRAQLRRPQLQRWRPPSASAEWFPHSESARGSARPVFLVAQCLEFVQSLGSAVASTCFFKQLSRWRIPTATFQLCSKYSKQKGCARLREGRGVWLGARKRRRTNPWAAFRVGEALHPGPNQDARRQRALHALAQMGLTSEIPVVRELEPPPSPGASEADTLTDTLSATTPFASPRAPDEVAPTAPDVATLPRRRRRTGTEWALLLQRLG